VGRPILAAAGFCMDRSHG